jgi:hypothetical protein
MSADNLYESFKKTMFDGLGEKYRYLRFNTDIYRRYPFRISQIREPRNHQNKPPYEDGFGFSGPGEDVIENMLRRFQKETTCISINLNDRTFTITEQGINELRRLDSSLV